MENSKLIDQLRQRKPELMQKYGIIELGVFGSRLRGDNRPDSDLDVLASFQRPLKLDFLGLIELEQTLSEQLGVKVDLALKENLKHFVGKIILSEVRYL